MAQAFTAFTPEEQVAVASEQVIELSAIHASLCSVCATKSCMQACLFTCKEMLEQAHRLQHAGSHCCHSALMSLQVPMEEKMQGDMTCCRRGMFRIAR